MRKRSRELMDDLLQMKKPSEKLVDDFLHWYKKDPHASNEEFYSAEVTKEVLAGYPRERFIEFFYDFAKEGGKIQGGGSRTVGRLKQTIENRYEEFRKFTLQPFEDDFDELEWLDRIKEFDHFGKGIATIYLNRVNKKRFVVLNNKVSDAMELFGIKLPTSIRQQYVAVRKAEQQLIEWYRELKNFYMTDALMHFLIGVRKLKELPPEYIEKTEAVPEKPVNRTAENLILYGPPGTGKTYSFAKYFGEYTTNNTGETEESYLARLTADKPWWQVVGAAVLNMDGAKVHDLLIHRLILAKLSQTNIQNPRARLWATLQSHTVLACQQVRYQRRLDPQIFWKDENSVWSVKKDLVQELAPEIIELDKDSRTIPPSETIKRYEFITFHQSYGYEEFVEGIRPVMDEDDEDGVQYRIEPGIFKKICQRAEKDPVNKYAIFIDEINRGNISKIFGELITLIEMDKRIGAKNELKVRLPYSKQEFGVPANLSIIGTMNTTDRSIAFIDIALRRRFQFKEMMPNLNVIEKKVGTKGVVEGVDVKKLLETMNRRIEVLYDRDHMIGHSYFLTCSSLSELKNIFLQNIIPLLQEYFYGDWEKISLVLGCGINSNGAMQSNQYPLIKAEKLVGKDILGLDHLDYDDYHRYEVNQEFKDAEGEMLNHFFTGIINGLTKAAEPKESDEISQRY